MGDVNVPSYLHRLPGGNSAIRRYGHGSISRNLAVPMTGQKLFNADQILAILESYPARSRAAFALSCAERLFPFYVFYQRATQLGDPVGVRAILDIGWNSLKEKPDVDLLRQLHARLDEYLPDDEDSGALVSTFAEDAIAATIFAIEALETGRAKPAQWAASRIYEACDSFVQASAPAYEVVQNIDGDAFVAFAAQGIYAALDEAGQSALEDLERHAREDGVALLAMTGWRP